MKINKVIREDLTGVDFTDVEGNVLLSVNLKDLPKEILTNLALHGIAQKVGDSYAGVKVQSEAVDKAKAVADRLVAGDWRAARQAASPRATQLAEALATAFGKTLEEANAALAKLSEDQIKELRKRPAIKLELQKIQAKKAAAKAKELEKEAAQDKKSMADLF